MLDPDTVIKVQIPDKKGAVLATVVSCSAKGNNCRLQLKDGEEIKVNITKCAYTVINKTPTPAKPDEDDDVASEELQSEEDDASEDAEDDDDLNNPATAPIHQLIALVKNNPNILIKPSAEVAELARESLKSIFALRTIKPKEDNDTAAANEQQQQSTTENEFEELYVDGFDAEQIWLQLDMAAGPALKKVKKLLRKADDITQLLPDDVEEALDEMLGQLTDDDDDFDDDDDVSDEYEEDEEEAVDLDGLDYEAILEQGGIKQHRKRAQQQDLSSDDDDEEEEEDLPLASEEEESEEEEEEEDRKGNQKKKRGRMTNKEARAAVEDDFMKLDDMEAFLLQAEQDAERQENEEEQDNDDDDDVVDPEAASDDSEAELEALLEKTAAIVGKKGGKKDKKKRVRFSDIGGSDDEDEDDDDFNKDDPEGYGVATYEDFFGPRKKLKTSYAIAASIPHTKKAVSKAATKKMAKKSGGDAFFSSDEEGGMGDGGSEDEDFLDDDDNNNNNDEERSSSDDDDDDVEDEESEEEEERAVEPSTHEKRMARMSEKVSRLEEAAMAEKDWFLRGEINATHRPKNSALELDLEFETTVKPPPQPTEESTRTLEDLIKSRIGDGQFDDVIRRAPAQQAQRTQTTVEMDEKKSNLGLGELYEKDYVEKVTGAVDDKDEPVRQLAKAQFSALCAQLDQLAHNHYRPVPLIEEVTVKVDVPALMMEEAAPAFVSGASMRAPEEVYRKGGLATLTSNGGTGEDITGVVGQQGPGMMAGDGVYKSEAELTREDRKRRRAAKKRASKKRKAGKDAERYDRAVAAGNDVPLVGRKSEEAEAALRKMSKASKDSGSGGSKMGAYTKSAKVFANLQSARENGAGGVKVKDVGIGPTAAQLKL